MIATGTHPYADLPELPEPLKTSLINLLRGAAELAEYRRLQPAERGKSGKGDSRKGD